MRASYRGLGAAALAALFVAALTAPGARAAETILVGSVGSASANLWPVTVGDKKGFFAAEGINIDMVFVQANAGVIQQLTVDAINVSVGSGLVDPIRAVDKGAPVAIARIEMQRPPYALMAKPAIKSIKDLKGKIVSVGGPKDIVLGTHGVLLTKSGRRAVFLPQVATEQGWDRETMLGELCRKAGLDAGCWRQGAAFSTFQADVFGETGPP